VLLVLPHDQVVGLKQEALDDLEGVAAPVDEVTHIVSGEEGLRFGRPEVLHLGDIDKLLGWAKLPVTERVMIFFMVFFST
jgi:hypothetical protein